MSAHESLQDMRVVVVSAPGAPDVLRVQRADVPRPKNRELLIKVAAAGVNRPDVMQRKGDYPPPPGASDVFGLEIAGHVVVCGPEASKFKVGDAVMALVASDGYADYAVVDERNALTVPSDFSLVEAAAIPETFFTVWTNVFERGALQAGESLLVHGGTSGIGTTAIQLAHAFGARVFTTAGSEEKCARCLELGADAAINYHEQDFVPEIKELTDGKGVDVVLDMVGGDYVNRNLQAAAMGARVVQIALMQGAEAQIDMRNLMPRRVTLTGSTLRGRSVEEKATIAEALTELVAPLWKEGRCRPVIDSTYALDDVVAAHQRMDEPHIGKIVLETGHAE